MKPLQTMLFCFTAGLLLNCSKPAYVEIVAHRGASFDAPENTIAAFKLAWLQGADGIEGDFYLTGDGEIVCIHDASTERTSGVDLVVSETSLAELRKLDVGRWKGEQWAGERIPVISEIFATVPAGKKMLIEVKCGPEIIPVLKQEIQRSGLQLAQLIIISFHEAVISEVKKQLPAIRAYWLTGYKIDEATGVLHPTIDEILATLASIRADGLDSNAHDSIDAAFVKRLHEKNMAFHVWTVDDPVKAERFIELGVQSITTNRPAWLREQLGDL